MIDEVEPGHCKAEGQSDATPTEAKEATTPDALPIDELPSSSDRWVADENPPSLALPETTQDDPFNFKDASQRPRPHLEIFTAETVLEEGIPQDFTTGIPSYSSEGVLRAIDGNIDSRTNSPIVSREGSVVGEETYAATAGEAFTSSVTRDGTVLSDEKSVESSTSALFVRSLKSPSENESERSSTGSRDQSERYNDKYGLLKKMRNSLIRTGKNLDR